MMIGVSFSIFNGLSVLGWIVFVNIDWVLRVYGISGYFGVIM